MAKKTAPAAAAAAPSAKLIPPPGGVTIRMYRIGHGDCFLLAFPGETAGEPVYVLIDCGYKPGSPGLINPPDKFSAKEITKNIKEATGGHIDVAVITHEHQDHVNGITAANFSGITIGEAWFAWTEDPADDVANDLRKKFKDKLVGLVAARNKLAAADNEAAKKIDSFLEFEFGGDDDLPFNPAAAMGLLGAAAPGESMNKLSMKVFKDLAGVNSGVKFIRPHEKILKLPGVNDVRVFPLGPPRNADQLADMDPQGSESFHSIALGAASAEDYFSCAALDEANGPFAKRYCIPLNSAATDSTYGTYFTQVYGSAGAALSKPLGIPEPGVNEVAGNAEWRRIDKDWLYSAEQLALAMNDQTNNASLVLAFELGKGGKVLLFAADAQRGNWASWAKRSFQEGSEKIEVRDLLSRTVVYKVGHHGSHNATLNGKLTDEVANISWMAAGEYAGEFTAMITAVRAWAETQKGWDRPQPAIKEALLKKAGGRVFQTDCDVAKMNIVGNGPKADWDAFQKRTKPGPMYFDYEVMR